ncbi:MAG: hypothetical protein ACFFAH_02110 [Promethearchaeota archaeon]
MIGLDYFTNFIQKIFNKNQALTQYIQSIFLVGSLLKKQENIGDIDLILILKPYKIEIINQVGNYFQANITKYFNKQKRDVILFWNPYCSDCKIFGDIYHNSIFINSIPHSYDMINSTYFERSALIFVSWMKEHLTILGNDFFESKEIKLNSNTLINGERGLNFTLLELRKTCFFIKESLKDYSHTLEKIIYKMYEMSTSNFGNLFVEFDSPFKFQYLNNKFIEKEKEFNTFLKKGFDKTSNIYIIKNLSIFEEMMIYSINWILKNHPNKEIIYTYENSKIQVR